MMKLRYRKRKRYLNLFIGLLWLTILVIRLFIRREFDNFDFMITGFALFFTGYFIYLSKRPVLTIQDSGITRHYFFSNQTIATTDLTEFEVTTKGDYVLHSTGRQKICFKPVYLNPESLEKFQFYISQLSNRK